MTTGFPAPSKYFNTAMNGCKFSIDFENDGVFVVFDNEIAVGNVDNFSDNCKIYVIRSTIPKVYDVYFIKKKKKRKSMMFLTGAVGRDLIPFPTIARSPVG